MKSVIVLVAMLVAAVTAAPASATSAEQQIAKAGVLRLTDFPAGWKQSARKPSSDAEVNAAAAKISSCKAFASFTKANQQNPRAKSPDFDLGHADVTNTVSVFPSEAKAVAAMKTFASSGLPTCLDKLFSAVFKAQLAKDPSVAKQLASVKVDIAPLDGVDIGDEALAYSGPVVVTLKDGTVQTVGLGIVTVRVGDAVSGFAYSSDVDVSAALQPAIVTSVKRLQDAVAST